MVVKPDETGLLVCRYGCHDCDKFSGDARNGVGLAAQHAEKYGHETWVEQVTSMKWNAGEEDQ